MLSLKFLLPISVLLIQSYAFAEQKVMVSIIESNSKGLIFQFSKKLVYEISQISDLDIKLVVLPGKRATQMLRNHTLDAELYRLDSYQQQIPNSIPVPESESLVPIFAYSAKVDFKVNSWESLKPFSMINVRGWLYPLKNLPNKEFIVVNSAIEAFAMLEAKRADIFVNNFFGASAILNSPKFKGTKIRRLMPMLGHIRFLTFFSGKQAKTAEKYNAALKEIKRNGTYSRIVSEILTKSVSR